MTKRDLIADFIEVVDQGIKESVEVVDQIVRDRVDLIDELAQAVSKQPDSKEK